MEITVIQCPIFCFQVLVNRTKGAITPFLRRSTLVYSALVYSALVYSALKQLSL